MTGLKLKTVPPSTVCRNSFRLFSALCCSAFISTSLQAQALNTAPDCSQAVATPEKLRLSIAHLKPIEILGVTDAENQDITIKTQCISQDQPLNYLLNFHYDADGLGTDTPRVRAKTIPTFFSWQDLKWVHSHGRVYDIVFKATDTAGASCTGTVNVGVTSIFVDTAQDSGYSFSSVPGGTNCQAEAINNPPIIYSEAITETWVNGSYITVIQGHDPDIADNAQLKYTLTTAPAGMSIDADSGEIQWQPSAAQLGEQTVAVRVSDPGGLRGKQTFHIEVQPALDELAVAIIANPTTGTSPLTVRFSPVVQNNNIVISSYSWDFNGDGVTDANDSFGQPKSYTYTGLPGESFTASLTITPAGGEPLTATEMITIDNDAPTVQVTVSETNGHVPLPVSFTVSAQDPQGIASIAIDYDGDGGFDETRDVSADTASSWQFSTTYQDEGYFPVTVAVTDSYGAVKRVTNRAITVDVNNQQAPTIALSAAPASGNAPLATTVTAVATLYDASVVTQWRWDMDGDGDFETVGGNATTDSVSFQYQGIGYYYPTAEVTTDSGYNATASTIIESKGSAKPELAIPNSGDTINSDIGELSTINITLPYETEFELWIENRDREKVTTLSALQKTAAGDYSFNWDGRGSDGNTVSEGDYYVVLAYGEYGELKRLDLRSTTGGKQSYYRRQETNPSSFDRLTNPIKINYAVDDPAEVSFFWQISFGDKLMTLMEHERMGRGQYTLYWNGEYPSGKKIPTHLNKLMPGIVRYALPDNVIFVKETPRIEQFSLATTMAVDPRREPIALNVSLTKPSTIEIVVSDMAKGVDVANRSFYEVGSGEQTLSWDGKNNLAQYLAPGDYRIGIRSVDNRGGRSLYWYRSLRINY